MTCLRSIYYLLLSCSEMDHIMVGMVMMHISAECWANNEHISQHLNIVFKSNARRTTPGLQNWSGLGEHKLLVKATQVN